MSRREGLVLGERLDEAAVHHEIGRDAVGRGSCWRLAWLLVGIGRDLGIRGRDGIGNARRDHARLRLRLDRRGDIFTGYASPDGIEWTEIGTREVSMAAQVTIGLGVTAHDNTIEAAVARFDEVSINGGEAN